MVIVVGVLDAAVLNCNKPCIRSERAIGDVGSKQAADPDILHAQANPALRDVFAWGRTGFLLRPQ